MAIVYQDGEPGKICTYCNTWKPLDLFYKSKASKDGYRPDCKPCILYRQRQRYNEKRDEILQKAQGYYQRNREKIIARVGEYQRRLVDRYRKYQLSYYYKNNEKIGKARKRRRDSKLEVFQRKARERYHNNADYREHLRVYQRRWRKENSDKVKAMWHRRRAKKRSAGDSFTPEQWALLKEHYRYTCLCCGRQEPTIKLTPDHVIPLGAPGTGTITNIQPLCLSCNSAKGAKVIDYRPQWDGETD
jgi:5-methylcytosine-specific restriction endonuclease McrA